MGQSCRNHVLSEYISSVSLHLEFRISTPYKCSLVGLRGGWRAQEMNLLLLLSWLLHLQIPQYKTLFENKPNMVPSFGIKISSEFENMNLDLDNIAEFKVPDVPPWTFSQPRVLFSLHNDKKSQTDPLVF